MHVDTVVVCGVAILVETRRWWWWWHAAALGSCGVSEVSDEHKMFVSTTTAKIVRADGDGLPLFQVDRRVRVARESSGVLWLHRREELAALD
jgi:hypothetical protein